MQIACAVIMTHANCRLPLFLQAHLDIGLQRRLRKSIVGAIISTDMSKHFEHCQAFNQHPPTVGVQCVCLLGPVPKCATTQVPQ